MLSFNRLLKRRRLGKSTIDVNGLKKTFSNDGFWNARDARRRSRERKMNAKTDIHMYQRTGGRPMLMGNLLGSF